jgi:menaquinone-9 beta-reductase
MVSRDVLIVGAGPAGLAAAIAVRRRGLDVTVVEALQPCVDKACGEGLMPDSRHDLMRLGVHVGPEDGAEFHGICFASHARGYADSVTADFAAGIGLGVRRLRLHRRMVEHAREIGVELRWGTRVSLRAGEPVTIGGEPYGYRYLVGADGQSSQVRRWAGLDGGTLLSRRFGFRAHFRVRSWTDLVEVHWGDAGQAYVTPVGDGEICVAGVTRDPTIRLARLLPTLPHLRERLRGSASTTRERGAVTTTRKLERVAAANVALIGDASGSVDAVTGEGLALSFRQAMLLADAIERDDLGLYVVGHPKISRLPQRMARLMLAMDRWPAFRDRAMTMLASGPRLFQRLVGVHLGDESMGHFLRQQGLHVGLRLVAPARFAPRSFERIG